MSTKHWIELGFAALIILPLVLGSLRRVWRSFVKAVREIDEENQR